MDDRARRVHSGAFSNANGISFGVTSGKITASYTVPSTAGHISAINVSAGTASNNLSAITFSNSNGLAFGLSGSVITGSYTVPGGGASPNFSAGTASANLASVVFSNSGGVSFGLNGSTITATVATSYRASNDAVGLNTALTANGVSWTVNSSGLSLNVPAFLTTARGSTDAIGLNTAKTNVTWTVNSSGLSLDAGGYAGTGFTSATTAGTAIVGTHNTAGLSLGVPAYITTAMLSNAATISNIKVSAGTSSTNLSALTFSDSNGVSWGLNGSVITASVKTDLNLYASGNTTDGTAITAPNNSVVFRGFGDISVGVSGSTVEISSPLLMALDPVMFGTLSTNAALGQNSIYFQWFDVPLGLSAYRVNFFLSVATTFSASNATGSGGYTLSAAIYTGQKIAGSTAALSNLWSGSAFIAFTNSSNTRLQVSHPVGISNSTAVSSISTSNASSNISTYLANSVGGFRALPFPISSTLTPGRYWMAVAQSSTAANASFQVNANVLFQVLSNAGIAYMPFGTSGAASNASFYVPGLGEGTYSATSGAFPATVALTTDAIRATPNQTLPYFNISANTTGTNAI